MKAVASLVILFLAWPAAAAQFVEVAAEIDITSWRYQEDTGLPLKSRRTYAIRCVVGTNLWFMEHHVRTNVKESVWFLDNKIIRQTTYLQDNLQVEPDYRTMRRGGRFANIASSPDGYPAGDLLLGLPWFAFCSGPYLKVPGRGVPLPVPVQNQNVFGFTNETAVFTDGLGLPRRAVFHTRQRQLKCDYQVSQFTNVLGWNFPISFNVVQHGVDALGQWNKQLTASGRLTSIRPAPTPELPEDIRERLEMWQQLPTRRR